MQCTDGSEWTAAEGREAIVAARAAGGNGRRQSEEEGDYMKYPLSFNTKQQQLMCLIVATGFLNSPAVWAAVSEQTGKRDERFPLKTPQLISLWSPVLKGKRKVFVLDIPRCQKCLNILNTMNNPVKPSHNCYKVPTYGPFLHVCASG